jgi:deoxycytidylate deaminase
MISNSLLSLTQKSRHRQHHHAAQIRRGGSVVASGYNHETRHAEVDALLKLWPSERKGTVVVSVRVTKSGRLSMGKPCEDCEAFLRANGVKAVIYSDFSGKLVKMKL